MVIKAYSLISILLSIIALVFSFLAFYFRFLRPAKLKLMAAEDIGLWHSHGNFRIDIPITISNNGTKTGHVHQIGIIINNVQNDDEKFFLKWNFFQKFDFTKSSWGPESLPNFISIPEKATVQKNISFNSDNSMKDWIPLPGKYKIYILAWTKRKETPDLSDRFNLNIDEKIKNEIKEKLDANKKESTYYRRDDWGKWTSKRLSKVEYKNLIRKS